MILELAVLRLFFSLELDLIHKNSHKKILNTYLLRMYLEVSAGFPGSATSQCLTLITWKYDRSMYLLVNLEV